MEVKNEVSARFIEAYEKLLSDKKVSDKRSFAAILGISASMVTEISKGRSSVGMFAIQNIVLQFGISAEWLLTGEGEMLKSKRTMGDNHTTVQPTSCNKDTQNNPDTQDLIRYLNNTIRQQAEEIGCLKERIRQMTIEKEKHVSHADTSNIASAG